MWQKLNLCKLYTFNMSVGPLAGKVCLVTGATRGIGRGIALQLGQAGATVYITGRTLKKPAGAVGGCLEDTAAEISARGGECISVQCDHSKDDDVNALFERIKRERDGQLDILVNNAYSAVNMIGDTVGKPFWELPDNAWDTVNNVGLRNHYLCTILASRLMVPRKQGLIVNISSFGGLKYLFNVPYGIGKAAVDRMAADCAVELRRHKVTMVSLWPGAVKTETIADMFSRAEERTTQASPGSQGEITWNAKIFEDAQSAEFSGICIIKLSQDPNLLKKTGRVFMTNDLAEEYGFTDIDGRQIHSIRSIKHLLSFAGWKKTSWFIPAWVKVPYAALTLYGSKF